MLRTVKRYFAGEVPLPKVFLRDMLLVGTMVNLVAGAGSLAAFSFDFPLWAVLAIHLSPVPYNIVLCVSVWRSAARGEWHWGEWARNGSIVWFVAMLIV